MEKDYHVLPDFILRTPTREASFPEKNLDDILNTFQQDHLFRTALLLSSPDLYDKASKSAVHTSDTQENKRLLRSLRKYYLRMGYRCTPFGMWAGFCHGVFGENSNIRFPNKMMFQTFSRPDMILLAHMAEKNEKEILLDDNLRLYPNNTIYNVLDEIRYIEYSTREGKRHYQIASIRKTPIVDSILSFCEQGNTANEIYSFLKPSLSISEAKNIVSDLIKNQLLKSSLEPTVTGPYYGLVLKQQLPANKTLPETLKLIHQFDNEKTHNGEIILKEIHKTIRNEYPKSKNKFTIQTDTLLLPEQCVINKTLTKKLLSALKALSHLTTKRNNEDLEQFKNAFMYRYNGNKMPMALLLDSESGIPYPDIQKLGDISPLVDNIIIPSKNNSPYNLELDSVALFLHRKIKDAQEKGEWRIELTDSELTELPLCDSTPHQMSALIRILSTDKGGDAGKILFEGTGGMGGANLFARMAHTNSDIQRVGQEICDFEASVNQDKIIAEVVHLPEDRIGNILSRPVFHKYEIPYLAQSSVDKEQQIPIADISISIENDRIVLRSERLNKEIIPRLTTAHNYHKNTLPVYRFLCDLQTDGMDFPGFRWDGIETIYDHLPAVWYRDVCFSPERWIIRDNALQKLKSIAKEKNQHLKEQGFGEWRKRMKMPEKIVYCIHDNEIPIDLSKWYAADVFLSAISNKAQVEVKENLFDVQNPFLTINEKPYTNEINIIFRKNI